MRYLFALVSFFSIPAFSSAADWEPMMADILKAEKLGFGGLTGIVVDRQTGDVYAWLSDKGLMKSTDQAKTFKPVYLVKGRTEWPGCMQTNPVGPLKNWVIALVYGGPILTSAEGEKFTATDKKSQHVDWVAVDWSDPEHKFLLTLKHESGDLLMASDDGGKSYRDVGKGYGPACIFDSKTAVAIQLIPNDQKKPPKRVLSRTTDAAKTFEQVAEYSSKAVPVWFGKTPYWLVDGAIITSKDQGKTWQKISEIKNGMFGPVFGKDEKHMFVLTSAGVVSTNDGGATWTTPIPPPKEMKGLGTLSWIGYDAKNDYVYLMKMGSDLYRMKR